MDYQLDLLKGQIRKTENECGESFLPVREVLRIDAFKGGKVVAGHQGLDLPCKHMTILETPEGVEWLRGKEFLLTTWYPFKNNEKMAADLIYRLQERKISAIGIKENRYLQRIPDEMLEQSDRYGLPLIILPYELIYTDTLSMFYETLFYSKNQYLLGLKDMYEKLSSLIFSSTNGQQVIDVLSVLTNATIVVFDAAWNLLFVSLNGNQVKEVYQKVIEDFKSYGSLKNDSELKIGNYFINVYPIHSESKTIAYVCTIGRSPSDNLTRNILRYGRIILCLKIVKEENEYLNNIKIKKAIAEIIMNKNDLSDEFYKNVNYAYDWEGQKKFIGICIAFEEKSGNRDNVFKEYFKEYFNVVVSRVFKETGFLITESDHKFFLFCSVDTTGAAEIIDKIRIFYRDFKDKLNLKFGISRVYSHIRHIPEMYNESLIAVEFFESGEFCEYESLDSIKLLYPLKYDRQVYHCYHDTILKLREYDDKSNSRLLNTLEAFFKYDMNKKMVADNLFIHPETLRYRLNRIEQLTGFSLNTSEGVFTLQMNLKLHKIISLQKMYGK